MTQQLPIEQPIFLVPCTHTVAGLWLPMEKKDPNQIFITIVDKSEGLKNKESSDKQANRKDTKATHINTGTGELEWVVALAPDEATVTNHQYIGHLVKGIISLAQWQQIFQTMPVSGLPSAVSLLVGDLVERGLAFVPQATYGLAFHQEGSSKPVRVAWIKAPNAFLANLAASKLVQGQERLVGLMGKAEAELINQQLTTLLTGQGETQVDIYDLRYADLETWGYHQSSRGNAEQTPEEIVDSYIQERLDDLHDYQKTAEKPSPQDRYETQRFASLYVGITEASIEEERAKLLQGIKTARAEELANS